MINDTKSKIKVENAAYSELVNKISQKINHIKQGKTKARDSGVCYTIL